MLQSMWIKEDPYALLVVIQLSKTTMEKGMDISQKKYKN